jgi:hypothetical protein
MDYENTLYIPICFEIGPIIVFGTHYYSSYDSNVCMHCSNLYMHVSRPGSRGGAACAMARGP